MPQRCWTICTVGPSVAYMRCNCVSSESGTASAAFVVRAVRAGAANLLVSRGEVARAAGRRRAGRRIAVVGHQEWQKLSGPIPLPRRVGPWRGLFSTTDDTSQRGSQAEAEVCLTQVTAVSRCVS